MKGCPQGGQSGHSWGSWQLAAVDDAVGEGLAPLTTEACCARCRQYRWRPAAERQRALTFLASRCTVVLAAFCRFLNSLHGQARRQAQALQCQGCRRAGAAGGAATSPRGRHDGRRRFEAISNGRSHLRCSSQEVQDRYAATGKTLTVQKLLEIYRCVWSFQSQPQDGCCEKFHLLLMGSPFSSFSWSVHVSGNIQAARRSATPSAILTTISAPRHSLNAVMRLFFTFNWSISIRFSC